MSEIMRDELKRLLYQFRTYWSIEPQYRRGFLITIRNDFRWRRADRIERLAEAAERAGFDRLSVKLLKLAWKVYPR